METLTADEYRIFCLRFLKDNRCYNQFINNLINFNIKKIPSAIEQTILDYYINCSYFSHNQESFITHAFHWLETSEKKSYWNNIDLKFRNFLNELMDGKDISYKE